MAITDPVIPSSLFLIRDTILITKLKQNSNSVAIKNAINIFSLSTYKFYQSIPKESRYSAMSFSIFGGAEITLLPISTSFFLEIDFQSCTSIS
jgi:hypothetical protein